MILYCALETYSLVGGIQNFNRRIIRHLGEIALEERSDPAHILLVRDRQEHCPQVPGARIVGVGASRLAMASQLLALLPKVEILILGHVNLLPFALMARLLRPSLPIMLFVYGDEVWDDATHRSMRFYEPWLLKCVSLVASISIYTARRMARVFRAKDAKYRLFPCAVDPVDFHRAEGPRSPTVLTVTRVGSGDREKHVDKVIAAVADLRREFPDLRYELVGDGVLRPELEAQAKALGVDDIVSFLGRVDDEALKRAYERGSIFVLPSSKEGFGIVYLEAWQRGLPVICSSFGASSEIVSDGEDGFAVDPSAHADLVAKMRLLLADPEFAARAGERGRAKVEATYLDPAFETRLRNLIAELRGQGAARDIIDV